MLVRTIHKDKQGFRTWSFGHGYSDYINGQAAIQQDIESALYEWQNDAFWALQNGINWKLRMGAHNQKQLLDADILRIVRQREDVIDVYEFQSTLVERTYSASCSVYTVYSQDPIPLTFTHNLE